MIVKCFTCGIDVKVRPSSVKERNFCGRDCYFKHKGRNRIVTVCGRCGKKVIKPPSKATETTFCSQSCHMKTLNENLNPTRMTMETRLKLSATKRKDDAVSYPKILGRHAHRVEAEKALGRPLKPGEVVHHIDRNKRNYHISNLMVFSSQAEHAAWHVEHDEKKEVVTL